jgi:hypothetical protein
VSGHFASLHHLGIIALQKGQPQAAIDAIGRALAANNRVPDCNYNVAFALQTLGRCESPPKSGYCAVRYRR